MENDKIDPVGGAKGLLISTVDQITAQPAQISSLIAGPPNALSAKSPPGLSMSHLTFGEILQNVDVGSRNSKAYEVRDFLIDKLGKVMRDRVTRGLVCSACNTNIMPDGRQNGRFLLSVKNLLRKVGFDYNEDLIYSGEKFTYRGASRFRVPETYSAEKHNIPEPIWGEIGAANPRHENARAVQEDRSTGISLEAPPGIAGSDVAKGSAGVALERPTKRSRLENRNLQPGGQGFRMSSRTSSTIDTTTPAQNSTTANDDELIEKGHDNVLLAWLKCPMEVRNAAEMQDQLLAIKRSKKGANAVDYIEKNILPNERNYNVVLDSMKRYGRDGEPFQGFLTKWKHHNSQSGKAPAHAATTASRAVSGEQQPGALARRGERGTFDSEALGDLRKHASGAPFPSGLHVRRGGRD